MSTDEPILCRIMAERAIANSLFGRCSVHECFSVPGLLSFPCCKQRFMLCLCSLLNSELDLKFVEMLLM